MLEDGKPAALGRETLVPLGLALTVTMAVCGAVVWLNHRLDSIDFNIQTLQRDVQGLKDGSRLELWARLLKAQNPALAVPEVHKWDDI